MDRRLHDASHLRAVAAGAPAPPFADGQDDLDGPAFLPPMRRRSRSGRPASRSGGGASGQAPAAPAAPAFGSARQPEPLRAFAPVKPTRPAQPPQPAGAAKPAKPARPAAAAPSGWMTDLDQLAAADAPPLQPAWPDHFTRPAPLGPGGQPGFAGPAFRPPRAGRWLRPAFPWLAPRSLGLLAGLALLASVVVVVAMLMGGASSPAPATAPVAHRQLRHLIGQLEECRGIESLLVMLPSGPEREATLLRLQRQQKLIDTWLRDSNAWLAASHGAQAAADLREANATWRGLQQRVVQAEVVTGRTGLANESRQLLTGPSAAAYKRMVLLVEGLSLRQPS
jgi:hypothetical protein